MGSLRETKVHDVQSNFVTSDATTPAARPKVSIRKGEATADDAAGIAQVGASVFRATFEHSCSAEDMRAFLEENFTPAVILAELSNPAVHFLIAFSTEHQRIVGFSALRTDTADSEPCVLDVPGRIELQRLYVDNAIHGTGAGKLLMDGAMSFAQEMGYKACWLGVWEFNDRAMAFYKKYGFERVGEHIFPLGVEQQTDYIFLKEFE